jgi:uncharacterized damage-inducible protein DinB
MSRAAVDLLLYQMDEAFSGPQWSSLLENLREVTLEDWQWLPAGGTRSIREMVRHIGACKVMYQEFAFGQGNLWWDNPDVFGRGRLATVESAIAWLAESQALLRKSVAALEDDSELLIARRANWGEMKETRWLVSVLIHHDAYHAGEINHLRALRRQTDAWEYPPPEEND